MARIGGSSWAIITLSLWAGWAAGGEATPWPRGHVFFAADFEGPDALSGWSGPAKIDAGYQGGHGLLVERPDESRGAAMVQRSLPAEAMRGYLLRFSATVKAENVSPKPQSWNGVKFMARLTTAQGTQWPSTAMEVGSFDWRPVAFALRVPDDAQQLQLCLGLEAVTGKAWFDNIRVSVWKPPRVEPPGTPAGPIYKGHDLPRMRGAMVGPEISAEGLRVLGEQWNANLIRWQLIRRRPIRDPLDLAAHDRWLQSALSGLDAVLPWCEKYGLRVVVDLHSPPGGQSVMGGYGGSNHGLFTSEDCQRRFVEIWEQIARRYQHSAPIWGYDLANEPVESVGDERLADWQELARRAARAIRAVDPLRTIIVEPARGGGPEGFRELEPLDVPNVVYSVHMYLPHSFTHQGVYGSKLEYRYPGVIDGRTWDKAQLEAALSPVIGFQKTYGVHIFVGEFSAIRWAPDDSAYRYLRDLIDVFEAHDWDWTYHAFREWQGWSAEHGSDRDDVRPASQPTEREKLLRAWLAKNQKPKLPATGR